MTAVKIRDLTFDIKGRDQSARAFDAANQNAKRFNSQLDRTQKTFSKASAAAKAFAGALAIGAITTFHRQMQGAVEETSRLAKAADKVGVTIEELQRLQFGFGQAGVAVSDLERNLEQWNKRVSEAQHFGSRLGDILKANGLQLTDSNGRLRSSVDLLKDFSELIKNAATDQERMTLATEAFGRSGGDMILALRGGADGIKELMDRADEAGGVIDDEMVRRAEELDDRFDAVSRTVDTKLKIALITAADWIDQAVVAANDLDRVLDSVGNAGIFEKINSLFGLTTDENLRAHGLTPMGDLQQNDALIDAYQRYGRSRSLSQRVGGSATIIPDDDRKRRERSAAAARKQVDAYQKVVETLQREREAIGLTAVEQRVLREQRRAGVDATSKQGQTVAAMVRQIESEIAAVERATEKQDAMNQSVQDLNQVGARAFMDWISGAQSAEEALNGMLNQLIQLTAQAALFGDGPFADLFGTSGSGGLLGGGGLGDLIGGLFGFGGALAYGGAADPWKSYLVGESGPEILHMGGRGGTVVPANRNAPQSMHITVGLSVDDDGKLAAFVKNVSGQTAAQVVTAAAPGIIDRSTAASGGALASGAYDQGMSKYGVSRQAKVR